MKLWPKSPWLDPVYSADLHLADTIRRLVMGSQYIQDMVQNLKEGRVSRRSFIQRMAALGVTAPIATQILAWNDVAMANATLEYKPTKAGGGGR